MKNLFFVLSFITCIAFTSCEKPEYNSATQTEQLQKIGTPSNEVTSMPGCVDCGSVPSWFTASTVFFQPDSFDRKASTNFWLNTVQFGIAGTQASTFDSVVYTPQVKKSLSSTVTDLDCHKKCFWNTNYFYQNVTFYYPQATAAGMGKTFYIRWSAVCYSASGTASTPIYTDWLRINRNKN